MKQSHPNIRWPLESDIFVVRNQKGKTCLLKLLSASCGIYSMLVYLLMQCCYRWSMLPSVESVIYYELWLWHGPGRGGSRLMAAWPPFIPRPMNDAIRAFFYPINSGLCIMLGCEWCWKPGLNRQVLTNKLQGSFKTIWTTHTVQCNSK